MEHKIDCATNSIGQIDEASGMGCTCNAEKKNNDSNSATVACYADCLPELETMQEAFFGLFGKFIPHIELFEEGLRKELRWFNEIGYKNGVIHAYKNILAKDEASKTA